MSKVNLICEFCKKEFPTPTKRYNYLLKKGRKRFYCNKECFVNDTKSSFEVKNCLWCKKEFPSTTHSRSKECCSTECSKRYSQSYVNGKNVSSSMKHWWANRKHNYKKKNCVVCGKSYIKRYSSKCCSDECSNQKLSESGRKSVKSQHRRSKNEILFASLCKQNYKNVFTNKPMFNGWDADIILPDWEVAILWNGKWHYEKLTEKHSLEQVQNRDKIKLDEITKCGYISYTIKDFGKFNPKFVEKEFNKFREWLHSTMEV